MKKKNLKKKIAAGLMALALCVSGMNASLAADDPTTDSRYQEYNNAPDSEVVVDGVYKYDPSDPLFAATGFHIFAEEDVKITAHCNGNIATKFLAQSSNSGSNMLYPSQEPEYNYIRKFQKDSVYRFGPETKVVYGIDTNVYLFQNEEIYVEVFEADGVTTSLAKMDIGKDRVFTEAANAGTDEDARFINFTEEFRKLSILSYNLAKEATTEGLTLDNNVVDMTNVEGTAYINVTPNDFVGNNAFIIDNTDFQNKQALVINVDLGTRTDYTLPFTQVLFKKDGISFGLGEDKGGYTQFDNPDFVGCGNVLWNFYGRDENGAIVNYTGTITTCTEFKGTVLAPDAEICTPASNQDGNFIGRQVHLGGGQTHRWDFGGKLPAYDYTANFGKLNAVATEKDADIGVPGVEIYVYLKDEESGKPDGDPLAKLNTGADGSTTIVGSLPMGAEYTGIVQQIPYGYELVNETASVTIASTDGVYTLEYQLERIPNAPTPTEGYIKVVVKDEDTGDYIKDVVINVKDSTGALVQDLNGSSTYTTDEFGTTKTDKLKISETEAKNKYTVVVTNVPTGYDIPDSEEVTLDDTNPNEITIYLSKTVDTSEKGSIRIEVYEKDTDRQKPVEGAVVSIKDADSHIVKEVTVVTGENGHTEEVENLPVSNIYTTTIINIPAGYQLETENDRIQQQEITTERPDVVIYELVKVKGSMKVVVEDIAGEPIEGAVVQIIDKADNDKVIATLTTDKDGETKEVYNLELKGEYTAKVVEIPKDYVIIGDSSKTGTVETVEDVLVLDFQIAKKENLGSLDVTVIEKDSNPEVKVESAVVNVYNSDKSYNKTFTTTDTGKIEIDNLPAGTYTIETTAPSGYEAPDEANSPQTATVEANGTALVVVKLEKTQEVTPPATGALNVTVIEKDSNPEVKVESAVVNVYNSDKSYNKTFTTTGTGKIEIDNLPAGTYTIETTAPSGYEAPDEANSPQTATVEANGTASVVVKLVKTQEVTPPTTGSINMLVKYPDDEGVGNVTATVTCGGTTVGTLTTANSGDKLGYGIAITGLDLDEEYTVTINETSIPTYYTLVEPADASAVRNVKSETITVAEPDKTVEFVLKHTGILEVTVKEDGTDGQVIPGAIIDVVKKDDPNNVIAEDLETDDDGKVVIKDLDTDDYTIIIKDVPDDYKMPADTEKDTSVTAGDTAKEELYVTKDTTTTQTGMLVVVVKSNTGDLIEDAKIVVTCGDDAVAGGDLKTSDAGITAQVTGLVLNKTYTATLNEDSMPEHYVLDTAVTGNSNPRDVLIDDVDLVRLEFIVKQTGALEITVKDKITGELIEGAEVKVVEKDNPNNVIKEGLVTDENGKVIADGLDAGDYTVIATTVPPKYNDPDPQDATVVVGDKVPALLEVSNKTTGKLQVLVQDANGTPVSGVSIKITDGTTQIGDVLTTGVDGKTTVISNLTVGKTYTATLDKSTLTNYYVLKDTVNIKPKEIINDTETFVIPFEVKKTGNLEVTIKDRNTQALIEGAKVTITNSDTNEEVAKDLVTDAYGKVTVSGLDGGNYTVTTTYVPNGYTAPVPETVPVAVGDTAKKELFVAKTPAQNDPTTPDDKGALQVQINDKNTGDPIPGATVVVKDPSGNVIKTVETDGNGMTPEVGGLTIGLTYTIETTKVPSGYTAPTPTTQKINGTTTEVVKLQVGRDSGAQSSVGSLFVIITDKNTGAVIPNATVEISNSAGEKLHTVTTDANGTFTINNMKPDTYTIKTTVVPSGYTAPDPETAVVVANARTDKHLYLVKGASSSNTNDNTPPTDTVVQTGDESNPNMAGILAVIALIGIVVVSIKRRKDLI